MRLSCLKHGLYAGYLLERSKDEDGPNQQCTGFCQGPIELQGQHVECRCETSDGIVREKCESTHAGEADVLLPCWLKVMDTRVSKCFQTSPSLEQKPNSVGVTLQVSTR
jgi:hypothetical protein